MREKTSTRAARSPSRSHGALELQQGGVLVFPLI
jgi:hypothetical protein